MITGNVRSGIDPVMDPVDKIPATSPIEIEADSNVRPEPAFGLRFAVAPPRMGEHGKTYYTVRVNEPTTISDDGKVITITDSVERERED